MRTVDTARHEKKRREILVAPGRCLPRSGFRGAAISAICAEAKISPGHLYHYFASKEAIVSAMAEASLAKVDASFREMARAGNVLTALIGGLQQATRPDASAVRAMVLELMAEAERNPAIAAMLREHSRTLRDQL